MEFLLIYAYIVLTKMTFVPITLSLFTVGLFVIKLFVQGEDFEESYMRWHRKWYRYIAGAAIVTVMMTPLVPSKKELAYIIGGGVVWKVAKDEEVQKLPHNVAEMANDFMEKANEGKIK